MREASMHMLGQTRLPLLTARELADAKRWGIAPDSTYFFLLEASAYRHERGEMNPVGSPLAGGGVVGRDDWWSVVQAAHGAPTQLDEDRKRHREQLYLAEMPHRDPVADAHSAAMNNDWRLYMGVWAEQPIPASDAPYRPLRFAAWGLLDIFGCRISEDQFYKNARRSWYEYYDINGGDFYIAASDRHSKAYAARFRGVIDERIFNYSGSPDIYYNTNELSSIKPRIGLNPHPREYHSIYNRLLYALSKRRGHNFDLPHFVENDCIRVRGAL